MLAPTSSGSSFTAIRSPAWMRVVLAFTLVIPTACAGTVVTVPTPSQRDAGTLDAQADSSPATNDAGSPDGATGDGASEDATAPGPPCQAPADCSGAANVCCTQIKLGAGSPPACAVESVVATCEARCNTRLPLSCNTDLTARLCNQASDCVEPTYNRCCVFDRGGNTATVCVDALLAGFAASCLP